MASRPELVEMCKELGIDFEDLTIEEMTEAVREEFDLLYDKRKKKKLTYKRKVGVNEFSKTLVKFLVDEYQYILKDKDGKEIELK